MDDRRLELLAENDREWRLYMIQEIAKLRDEVSHQKVYTHFFRVIGSTIVSAVFILFGVYIEWRINPN